MKTIERLQANPKLNVKGGLGSRNRVPVTVDVDYYGCTIWCVDKNSAIYKNNAGFNETIDLHLLPESILLKIESQL